MGRVRGDRPLRARGLRVDPAGVARHVLPLVGHLHPGRRRGRGRRQGRRGEGGALLHAAHPHPQRHPVGRAAPRARRSRPSATRAAWPTSPSARTCSSTGCGSRICPTIFSALWRLRAQHPRHLRRRHAQHHRLPAGRARRRRDRGRLAARARRDRDAQRQPRVLQPAAQVQGLDHRLPRLVHAIPRSTTWGSPPSATGYTGHVGFSLRVGGGLSTEPHLAPRLDAFVRPDQVLAVVKGVSEIFRDSDVLRQNREKARLKFLFLDHGWTPDRFLDALEARLGFRLDPAVPEIAARRGLSRPRGDPSAEAGRPRLRGRLPILRGRLTPDEMRAVAGLAERFGTGELRTTTMQNLVIVNVPRARAGELGARDRAARASGSTRRRSAAAPWPARAASSASSR